MPLKNCRFAYVQVVHPRESSDVILSHGDTGRKGGGGAPGTGVRSVPVCHPPAPKAHSPGLLLRTERCTSEHYLWRQVPHLQIFSSWTATADRAPVTPMYCAVFCILFWNFIQHLLLRPDLHCTESLNLFIGNTSVGCSLSLRGLLVNKMQPTTLVAEWGKAWVLTMV